MKKINTAKLLVIIFLLTIFCLIFTACDPGEYSFDYDELKENITSVELVNYDNQNQKSFFSWVLDKSSQLAPLNINKLTVLEKLNTDNMSEFLFQLSKVDFLYKYYAYNSPKGISIKLTYKNNDFLIISCNYPSFAGYVGQYNSNCKVVEFIGCFASSFDFRYLVNTFFETQIS